MAITLCFDLGNTRLKCAVFDGKILKETVMLQDTNTVTQINSLLQQYHPEKTILSSVIRHDTVIEEILAEKTKFHQLSHLSRLPVATPVGRAETIGADRLAICAAAVHLYPHYHHLVIGLGSCITYNFVDKFHDFLGGSISPGMYMRFRAMHEYTAFLPLVQAEHNFPLIGYDTKTNLLSGVILGMSKEIDGIIEAYTEKYNDLVILLTGGDMDFFLSHLKNKVIADPDLLFKGLFAISELNNE
jgi:type III pantothenate kinase